MMSSERLKALIRNKAKALNINSNIILRRVIFEFFLEKLSISKYADKFIIKGGFLISSLANIELRTTLDLDVTLKALAFNKTDLEFVIKDIISIPTNELLEMQLVTIDEIHEGAEYPGFRASVLIIFDTINEQIKIDFTTGDIITPKEINFHYQTLLDDNVIKLKSYNIETVLAEKLETIFSRGVLNTRMRDFYDIFILFQLKDNEENLSLLKSAFINTSKSRNTFEQISLNINSTLHDIINDQTLKKMWHLYQQNYPYAQEVEWEMVMSRLKEISNFLISEL